MKLRNSTACSVIIQLLILGKHDYIAQYSCIVFGCIASYAGLAISHCMCNNVCVHHILYSYRSSQ